MLLLWVLQIYLSLLWVGVAGLGVVAGGVAVAGVVEVGSALLISWCRCCLLTTTPVAAELMRVVLVSGFAGSSSRVVWYSVPGPALDPMVVILVVYWPRGSVRCS